MLIRPELLKGHLDALLLAVLEPGPQHGYAVIETLRSGSDGALDLRLGLYGYRARRRRRPGWPPHHAIGMGGSYIALLTGFYVDNGPFLPLWDRLPHIAYWLLPTLVGIPLIWIALRHFQQRPILNSQPAVDRRRQRPL